MNWLLDTDVLSQLAKRQRDQKIVAWIKEQRAKLYTSSIVIAQLGYWIRTETGVQRQQLQSWLTGVLDAMSGRVLGFNLSLSLNRISDRRRTNSLKILS
jgi:predicted nucleic acid-binding protein